MKKDIKFHNEALTFDDVLLVPAYSQIIPSETNVRTSLTKNINLNIPLLSASMDTVTESNLAIALALKGGIGIIHKNMSIDNQCNEIRRVKRSQSGMIKDPITMHTDATVKDALQIMKKHQIGGIPIINSSNELIGIVTNRDLRFQKEDSKQLSGIMTKRVITAKSGISLDDAEKILKKLNGKSHFLISSVCISKNGSMIWNHTDKAKLTMKNFSDDELKSYLSKISDETLYAYNVYQIEGEGRNLFSAIEGDEDTIMGLPVKKIKEYISLL